MIGRNRSWALLIAGLIVASPLAAHAVPATQGDWRRDALTAANQLPDRSDFRFDVGDLQPEMMDSIVCADSSLCPGMSAALEHAQRWLNRPASAVPLLTYFALVILGSFWIFLARRSILTSK